jgi:hypothetical protein
MYLSNTPINNIMADSDLGSFFDEINQITASTVAEAETETEIGPQMPPAAAAAAPTAVHTVVAQPQVISKPAELSASNRGFVREQIVSSSHPVYTYNLPEPPPQASSSSNGSSTNDSLQQFSAYYKQNTVNSSSNTSNQPSAPYPVASYHSNSSGQFQPPLPPGQAPIPKQDKVYVRKGADSTWVDETLSEWPENDFRIFVGDLAKEVTTEMLEAKFNHYPSYAKAKVRKTLVMLLCCYCTVV